MGRDNTNSELTLALTQASFGKLPPKLHVATGHDEHVMLFLLRVADPDKTARLMTGVITLSEADAIVDILKITGGLIRKRFHIDDAWRIKDQLLAVGTDVEFVRPDELDKT